MYNLGAAEEAHASRVTVNSAVKPDTSVSMMPRVYGLVGLEEGRSAPARLILSPSHSSLLIETSTVWSSEGSNS